MKTKPAKRKPAAKVKPKAKPAPVKKTAAKKVTGSAKRPVVRKTAAKVAPIHKPMPPRPAHTRIAELADDIREATTFLMKSRNYSLEQISWIAGGSSPSGGDNSIKGLHKNSVMKIKLLKIGYVVQAKTSTGRQHWVPAKEGKLGWDGSPGQWQWLWNPQIDTIQKLERVLAQAVRLGFVPVGKSSQAAA